MSKKSKILSAINHCVLSKCDDCPYADESCGAFLKDINEYINSLEATVKQFQTKITDGELVSKEWHDEQVMHLENELEKYKENKE